MRRLLTVLLVACAALATAVAPAQAHNVLTGSDPKNGAQVTAVPARVTLTFDQPVRVEFAQLALTTPSRAIVKIPDLKVRGTKLIGTVPTATAGAGVYAVGYQIVSNDGHPVTGTILFTVTSGTPPPPTTTAGTTPTPGTSTTPVPPADGAGTPTAGAGAGNPTAGTGPGNPTAGAEAGNPTAGAGAGDPADASGAGDPADGVRVATSAVPQAGGGSWVWGLLVVALLLSGLGILVVVRRPAAGRGQGA
ncbi:copper resistance CopC family protein [Sphaerisporangium aureirubrum]|uniref:Copper resistance CopC family protein n=1 Tax=Sphaerisporangium aureirubrum TaxID=1544736 RepID=A0ABW1NH57_9ACTN